MHAQSGFGVVALLEEIRLSAEVARIVQIVVVPLNTKTRFSILGVNLMEKLSFWSECHVFRFFFSNFRQLRFCQFKLFFFVVFLFLCRFKLSESGEELVTTFLDFFLLRLDVLDPTV